MNFRILTGTIITLALIGAGIYLVGNAVEKDQKNEAKWEKGMCAFQITMVTNAIYLKNTGNEEHANSNEVEEAQKLAERECSFTQSDDEAYIDLAKMQIREQFKFPESVEFKNLVVLNNYKTKPARRVSGTVAARNVTGDHSDFIKFTAYIDPVAYQWVIEH